jgi:ribosomal protein S6
MIKFGFLTLNHAKIIRAQQQNKKGIKLRIYKSKKGRYYLTSKETDKPDATD